MKTKTETQAPTVTFISKSTLVNADIECVHDLRISGTIEGETKAHKKLILTDSGIVKGSIHSPIVDISGKVVGDIRASEALNLRASAVIDGKIFTKRLTIEDGAQVKGSFNVGPDVKVKKVDSNSTENSTAEAGKHKKKESDSGNKN